MWRTLLCSRGAAANRAPSAAPTQCGRKSRGVTAAAACLAGVFVFTLTGASTSVPARAQQTQTTAPKPATAGASVTHKPAGKAFSSPEQAAEALHQAAKNNDDAQILIILGPGAKQMITWIDDPAERKAERDEFAVNYEKMHRLVNEPDGTIGLYVGAENWPLPIPLVRYNGAWYFDTDAGVREVLYRRIGRNEIEALEVCHALVDAEKDYYAGAHGYTFKFTSSPGGHDGLYWTGSGERSPIGPYLAHAGLDPGNGSPTPYHGYYYRILAAPNAGFAILAFPAEYRSSGVFTLLMDHNGNAVQKDLGPKTDSIARQMRSGAVDSTWKKSE
jgi:hypothetical protein